MNTGKGANAGKGGKGSKGAAKGVGQSNTSMAGGSVASAGKGKNKADGNGTNASEVDEPQRTAKVQDLTGEKKDKGNDEAMEKMEKLDETLTNCWRRLQQEN